VPYVQTVKTAPGASAVPVVYSSRRGLRDEHLGSAHDAAELEALRAARACRVLPRLMTALRQPA
jgi:hypothetical protein